MRNMSRTLDNVFADIVVAQELVTQRCAAAP